MIEIDFKDYESALKEIKVKISGEDFDICLISLPMSFKGDLNEKILQTDKEVIIQKRMLEKDSDDKIYLNLIKESIYSIAIDGPSGSGKSTVSKLLSQILGIEYLDTGAMYRAIAFEVLNRGIDLKDQKNIRDLVDKAQISYESGKIFINCLDVSDKIRTNEISMASSVVSQYPFVRERLVDIQRKIAKDKSIILDGRDIGTHVLKDADYKFYITASPEIRADRRYKELNDDTISYDKVLEDIRLRDKNDMEREISPLRKAKDAYEIVTDDLTVDQVIESIIKKIRGI
ncbi:MAG: (d)CMP kinase [Finegoldia sp.]|nr:(d)CMP kinase [Finegoldia sp.]